MDTKQKGDIAEQAAALQARICSMSFLLKHLSATPVKFTWPKPTSVSESLNPLNFATRGI
jgi:hypothetical protein